MPTNKDLKRLVRDRMRKTGESYTTSRAQIVNKSKKKSASRATVKVAKTEAAGKSATSRDYAALAGMSDAAVKAKTGCTWERWVYALDRRGAASLPHREIAAIVHEKYKIPGWWAQTVTVGYERIKGLREIGQRRSGTYEASKSKTLPVAVGKLYRAFSNARTRSRWLPGARPVVRKTTPDRSVRMTWEDGTSVEAHFTAKSSVKSAVAVQHRKLASRADATRMKKYWSERLAALAEVLVASGK